MSQSGNQPEISIITVCYNSGTTLARTLASIESQKFRSFEHILIDGQSTDNSLLIARDYEKCLNTTIISERDNGIYDAMNKGLCAAKGRFIHFLNADDYYVTDDSLNSVAAHLDEDCLNYANLVYWDYENNKRQRKFQYQKWKLHVACSICQPVTLYPRRLIEKVGKFETKFQIAADYDYLMRCLDVSRPNYIDVDFVEMSFGGVSSVNVKQSFREFREISIQHGCPRQLANLICYLKTWNATRKLTKTHPTG